MRSALCLILALSLASCSTPPCTAFIGSPDKSPVGEIVISDGQTLSDLKPEMEVLLHVPPQGGYVFFVGARVRNLKVCDLSLQAQLRDLNSNEVVAVDKRVGRVSSLVIDQAAGWAQSRPDRLSQTFSHVAACPNFSAVDLSGRRFNLELEIVDPDLRRLDLVTPIIPKCPDGDAQCDCMCRANYQPGKC